MSNKVLVLGAINIDIITNTKTITKEDSNISKINMSFGGVGGNIAFNLANLNCDVHMLTVLGNDHFKPLIISEYSKRNITLHYKEKQENTNVYLAIMKDEDMLYGFNDMELINHFDIDTVKIHHKLIKSFDYLILDNNLPLETLKYITKTYQDKVISIDAVSISKAHKILEICEHLDYLKVNKTELNKISNQNTLEKQLKELHNKGVKNIIVTNKEDEIIDSTKENIIKTTPKQATNIINTSGCGDAFFSGYMYGIITGYKKQEALKYAKDQAYKTLFVKESTI